MRNAPPVTHYRLGEEGTFYAEFLTPLVGRPRAATTKVAGVAAQALRHLDLLMISPWSVFLRAPEYPVGTAAVEVQIANPTSYLAQKLLVLKKRSAADRSKDVLYLHDTLITFGGSLAELQRIWIESVSPSIHPTTVRTLRRIPRTLFARVTESVRDASRVARDAGRPVASDEIAQVCRVGLAKVFGNDADS